MAAFAQGRIGETLLLGSVQSGGGDEDTLALAAVPRASPLHDHGAQRRIFARTAGERGVATGQEFEVIEFRAGQAKRLAFFEADPIPRSQLRAALRALRLAPDDEDNDLTRLLRW